MRAVPGDTSEFLAGIPLPMVVLDAGGAVVNANSRFSHFLGYLQGELGGTDGFGLVDPGDRDLVRSLVQQMRDEGGLALTAWLLRKDGSRVRSQSFWSVSRLDPSLPPLSIGLFVEIPAEDQPDLTAAISTGIPPQNGGSPDGGSSRARNPASGPIDPCRRNQIIHTIIFHDAKNRLAALHGYADLLKESLSGSGFLSYVDKLEEIASDIERDLGVASMFSHVGLIAPQWQNIRDVVLRSASREPGGRIFMEDLPGSPWCLADPLFPRVFSNLFENARRHGERVTAIRIGAMEGEGGLVISVEDDGVGIPADQKERIFEHGFGRHTGYGLYLAREVLTIAGFSIHETGDPGKGARFDIHIPRGKYAHQPSCPEEPDPIRIPAA
ncbi:MAG: PAS domain-containing sensor histidine kinase [Methanomicrobiales archaeon]|nr:PAS domain-containing sensor histidine kinase [Methanomicrobiales archaeon]